MGRRKAEGGEKSGGGKGGPGLGNLDVETAELYSGQIPSFVSVGWGTDLPAELFAKLIY